MGQALRNVLKVGYTNGEDNPPCTDHFASVKADSKTIRLRINTDDVLIFELGDFSVAECEPVARKRFEAYRNTLVVICNSLLRAKLAQRVVAIRIGDVRGEAA